MTTLSFFKSNKQTKKQNIPSETRPHRKTANTHQEGNYYDIIQSPYKRKKNKTKLKQHSEKTLKPVSNIEIQ